MMKTRFSGFTLLEMIIVLLIISIALGLSIPRLASTAQALYFQEQAGRTGNLLGYIKQRAVLEGKTYKYIIHIRPPRYEVWKQEETGPQENNFVKSTDSLLRERSFPAGISVKLFPEHKEKEEIVFLPDGTISAAEFMLADVKNHGARLSTTLSGEIVTEMIR